ncbi:MAG: EamA family transporter [Ignavibacterium sp.]|nr:MAG: EamA family transporter [Ignavibacterium sp.]
MASVKFKAYLAWIAICIIWGTTYLFIRIGVEALPPMLFAGVRWIIAGSILVLIQKALGNKFPTRDEILPLAIVGIALLGIANGLVVVAEQWIPSGLAALLITTLPFWMVGFESLLPKGQNINRKIIFGLIIGLIGVLLILGRDIIIWINIDYFVGTLALMGAVISWSLGSIYSKYRRVSVHPMMGAAVQMLIAGSLQALLGLALGEHNVFQLSENGIIATAYLIIFGSIFGYASYMYAIQHLPLSLVSTYAYINPVIALFLGWYFLDEQLTINILFATILILIGVMLVQRGSTLAQADQKM